MSWLLYLLLMNEPAEAATKPASIQTDSIMTTKQSTNHKSDEEQPDMELLLFLAEWDGVEKDEWVDPEVFAQDSQFNQQLDNNKAQGDEEDPDNH